MGAPTSQKSIENSLLVVGPSLSGYTLANFYHLSEEMDNAFTSLKEREI